VVVTDNPCAHKSARARAPIEARGASVVFLPPHYPPDLNPIEEAFPKVKEITREAEAGTPETPLFEATHRPLGALTVEEASGSSGRCGYRTPQTHSLCKSL
jgi:transposase